MNAKTTIISRILFWLVVVIIAIYILFPFYWMINTSLKTEEQSLMTPTTFLPRDPQSLQIKPTFQNYLAVFKDKQFFTGFKNSVIVATSTTLFSLMIGSFGAFALGKLRFRGKRQTLYVILSMTMFPQIAVLTGLVAVVRILHFPGIPSMVLSYLLFNLPFTVWVLTAFFKDLPTEIMQAAQVDGSTPFQTFRMILLPLIAPALVTTGLLAFINAWNEYLFALIFTAIEIDARPITVVIALSGGLSGEIMAASVLTSIPLVVLVLIFQRRIIAGLTGGAVS